MLQFITLYQYRIVSDQMNQNCSFCNESSIIHCLNRSLYFKHNEFESQNSNVIDNILLGEKAFTKCMEIIFQSGRHQIMIEYLNEDSFKQEIHQALEYYKYRVYVPVFPKSKQSDTITRYYYSKLKHYYNNLKRQMRISIDPTESKMFTSLNSFVSCRTSATEVLKAVKHEIELQINGQVRSNINSYKSESKALQEMLSYIKTNNRFEEIKTLTTEDCFNEQEMFQQMTRMLKQEKAKSDHSNRINIKAKLFKKVDGPNCRETPILRQFHRDCYSSRAISINLNEQSHKRDKSHTKVNLQQPFSFRIKQTLKNNKSTNSLTRKCSSLGKLNPQHNSSPFKKQSLEVKTKNSSSTVLLTRLKANTKTKQTINRESNLQIKDSILKIQKIKLQKQVSKDKVQTNCSSTKKTTQQNDIISNDNIYSIRRKRIEKLKQKSHPIQKK